MASIQQTEEFGGVNAEQVYSALMSSKKHADFTGAGANISSKVGGEFTAWDDYIEGTNTELVVGKKIVQKWRASDWPEGEWSEVTYVFKDTKDGCELEFVQTGVPNDMVKDVEQGWIDYYWEPLRKYFHK